jgi:hypothetical protein
MDGSSSTITLNGKNGEPALVACQIQLVSIPHYKLVQGLRLVLTNSSITVDIPLSTFHLKKEADSASEMRVLPYRDGQCSKFQSQLYPHIIISNC